MLRFMLVAYMIGAVPNAYLVARWFGGRDIRVLGSRNAGATNVAVSVGWFPGLLTLLGDIGKGYLAAAIGGFSSIPLVSYLTPACAIAGHNWPIWLRFRGGGGLATLIGGCIALAKESLALAGLAMWGLPYLVCRDHDKSAVLACIFLPVTALAAQQSAETVTLIATSSLVILLRRVQSMSERVRRWRSPQP